MRNSLIKIGLGVFFLVSLAMSSSLHASKKKIPAKTTARTSVKTAGAAKARIPAKIPKGSLAIISQPPGAELIFNNEKKGVTPLVVKLNKKSNRIVLRLKGYKSYDGMIEKNTLSRQLTVGLNPEDRKSTRLNSSHSDRSRMPSSA